MAIIENPIEKKCLNHCPNCGATDPNITWGEKEWMEDQSCQDAKCLICGCYFKEYYSYAGTEFEVGIVPRIPCDYPMSVFYNYKDEVREDDRVSTSKDCARCTEGCYLEHCLIQYTDEGTVPASYRRKKTKYNIDVGKIKTAASYALLNRIQQVIFLMGKYSLSEKEAWECRTDDIYGLPFEIASSFEGFDEDK